MKSLGNFPDPFIAEISGQPDALRRAAEAIREQAIVLDEVAESAAERTVVFTGMGSSYDACYPAVTQLARDGIAAVMLDSAELLHFRTGMLGPRTVLVAVSQSGESAEVVRVIEDLRTRAEPPRVIAVTNSAGNTLASLADLALDTRAGDETGPSTLTFAASLVAVGALGRVLGGHGVADTVQVLREQSAAAATAIERLLQDGGLADRIVDQVGARGTVVILGRGPARAAAEMGALTVKEAVGMPIESLQTAQFRHGPLELAGPELAAFIIATEPETLALDLALADELLATGAGVLTVTTEPGGPDGAMNVSIGAVESTLASAVSILPAQLLAWRLSILRGREPGAYYLASKVTSRE
jgi:glucosamine--fructose-6-phosphate aminotransferase (isomerizing)